ncbi:hypothetical protein ACE6H2_026321 [Prunus campanulata]
MDRGQSKTRPPKARQQSFANSTQTLYPPPPPLSTSPSSVPQPTTLSRPQTPKTSLRCSPLVSAHAPPPPPLWSPSWTASKSPTTPPLPSSASSPSTTSSSTVPLSSRTSSPCTPAGGGRNYLNLSNFKDNSTLLCEFRRLGQVAGRVEAVGGLRREAFGGAECKE